VRAGGRARRGEHAAATAGHAVTGGPPDTSGSGACLRDGRGDLGSRQAGAPVAVAARVLPGLDEQTVARRDEGDVAAGGRIDLTGDWLAAGADRVSRRADTVRGRATAGRRGSGRGRMPRSRSGAGDAGQRFLVRVGGGAGDPVVPGAEAGGVGEEVVGDAVVVEVESGD